MLLSVGYRRAYFNAFLRFGQEMNKTYKLEIPRFISAVLAAKPPAEQFARRGRWFVGEKAGERFAVNRIPTPQERRALLVCLMPGVSVVTAQEVGERFGKEAENAPLRCFFDSLKKLVGLKIARVEGEELGEPMRIFSHIRKTWGRVEWAFTSDYLRWCDQYPRQAIRYPVQGLAADLKKYPMASMVMLAAAEWYSMNKRKANGRFISVSFLLTYYPYDLGKIRIRRQVGRDIIQPLKRTLGIFGVRSYDGKAQGGGTDSAKMKIDLAGLFPKQPTKAGRKKPRKKSTAREV